MELIQSDFDSDVGWIMLVNIAVTSLALLGIGVTFARRADTILKWEGRALLLFGVVVLLSAVPYLLELDPDVDRNATFTFGSLASLAMLMMLWAGTEGLKPATRRNVMIGVPLGYIALLLVGRFLLPAEGYFTLISDAGVHYVFRHPLYALYLAAVGFVAGALMIEKLVEHSSGVGYKLVLVSAVAIFFGTLAVSSIGRDDLLAVATATLRSIAMVVMLIAVFRHEQAEIARERDASAS